MEVAGPPSSPTKDHAVGDTKKSLQCSLSVDLFFLKKNENFTLLIGIVFDR